jgi:hypothetical protein
MTFARRSEETLEIWHRNCSQPIRRQYGASFSLHFGLRDVANLKRSGLRSRLS